MSATVTKLVRRGTPESLLTNLVELAPEMECVITVSLMKNGMIETEWSALQSNIAGIGLIEILKLSLIEEM